MQPEPPPVKATRRTVRAEPYDSPLRWLAYSASRPGSVHLVDLAAYEGNGGCACEHFLCRLEPLLRLGARPSNRTRCKHIIAVRHYLVNRVIKQLSENENDIRRI